VHGDHITGQQTEGNSLFIEEGELKRKKEERKDTGMHFLAIKLLGSKKSRYTVKLKIIHDARLGKKEKE